MSTAPAKSRLAVLDDLRGIAALAVCIFHTEGQDHPGVASITRLGFFGVYVFFVISGFILPYTMQLQKYQIGDYGRFMAKRLARLYPPYLVSIALTLGLMILSGRLPGFQGTPYVMEWPRLWTNLTYTAGIFGLDWLNIIYWTLGIEFQYYLLVGLIYPWLSHGDVRKRLFTWALLAALAFVPAGRPWVLMFLPLFLLGFWAWWHHMGRWRKTLSWTLFAGSVAVSWIVLGMEGTVVAGATALVIAFSKSSWRPLRFLGLISYSVYLVHPVLYHYMVRFRDRAFPHFPSPWFQLLELVGAIFLGWIFYRLVEVPSMRLANRIRYARQRSA